MQFTDNEELYIVTPDSRGGRAFASWGFVKHQTYVTHIFGLMFIGKEDVKLNRFIFFFTANQSKFNPDNPETVSYCLYSFGFSSKNTNNCRRRELESRIVLTLTAHNRSLNEYNARSDLDTRSEFPQ